MALTAEQVNFVEDAANVDRTLMGLYLALCKHNALWNGSPSYRTEITDLEIAEVPAFSGAGLTWQHLADAESGYAQIKQLIENLMVPLSVLASTS